MAGIGNDLVREARRRAALSQRELAERAGTTQSAIARLETGRSTPSFDTVLRLVRLCGLDLEVMLVERDGSDWAQAQRLRGLTATSGCDAWSESRGRCASCGGRRAQCLRSIWTPSASCGCCSTMT